VLHPRGVDYTTSECRKVLSIWDQDQPIALEFVDADFDLNQAVPRPHDTFSDNIEVAFVGQMIVSTSVVGGAALMPFDEGITGLGVTLWPIPETERALHYTYMHLHSALDSDSDTFARVPDNVIRLIEWRAVEMAYASGITTPRWP
jgi:hypothetical protein